MLTADTVTVEANSTLARFPYLSQRVSDDVMERSVAATWPDPPAPLVYWLWVAGSDHPGSQAAEACVQSLELILALLQNSDFVRGAWQSRVAKLIPPRGRASFEHFSSFRSSLFELIAAYRLVADDAKVILESDQGAPGCDLTVVCKGLPLLHVEAYGPQKGILQWYEDEIARPWRALALEQVEQEKDAGVQRIAMSMDAAVSALSNVLTDSNFQKQKAKQLAAGQLPTLLMVRAYGLTKRIEELATTPTATELARRMGDDAWSCLPPLCLGILVAFLGDAVQQVIRGQSPVMFVPAPNRVVTDDVWEYLRRKEMLTRDLLRDHGATV